MESQEQRQEKDLKEKRLTNRLRLATTRIKDVERERIWALATAHSEGLSIRKIAEVTGLSSSRVHQLLHTDEARQIPDWLSSPPESNIKIDAWLRERSRVLSSSLTNVYVDASESPDLPVFVIKAMVFKELAHVPNDVAQVSPETGQSHSQPIVICRVVHVDQNEPPTRPQNTSYF